MRLSCNAIGLILCNNREMGLDQSMFPMLWVGHGHPDLVL